MESVDRICAEGRSVFRKTTTPRLASRFDTMGLVAEIWIDFPIENQRKNFFFSRQRLRMYPRAPPCRHTPRHCWSGPTLANTHGLASPRAPVVDSITVDMSNANAQAGRRSAANAASELKGGCHRPSTPRHLIHVHRSRLYLNAAHLTRRG